MKQNMEPWSKRVWYAEALIIFIIFWIVRILMVMVILIILSLIITAIISVTLKVSEPKTVKSISSQKPTFSFMEKLNGNVNESGYDEEQYNTLRNTLNKSKQNPVIHKIRLRRFFTSSRGILVCIIVIVGLPFLFSFIFIHAIADTLTIDFLLAVNNTYLDVMIYTNLIYYGIIGLSFLCGGLGGLLGEDSGMVLPVSMCFIVIFMIIGVMMGYQLCKGFAVAWFG